MISQPTLILNVNLRLTTCFLDLCPSWLIKVSGDGNLGPSGGHYQSVPGFKGLSGGIKRGSGSAILEEAILRSDGSFQLPPSLESLFLGKVIKRVVAEQLQNFLEDTSVLDPF